MRLSIPNLLPGTTYAIQVRADDGSQQSAWSNIYELITQEDLSPPAVPTSVTWAVSGDAFYAEWNPVLLNEAGEESFVTRYELELVGNTVTKIVSVPHKTNERLNYTLAFEENRALFGNPSGVVTLRVRAVDNKEVKSDWTVARIATNPAPAAPTAPDTGVIAAGATDAIMLAWKAPADDDLVGYNIHVGSTAGFTATNNNRIFSGFATGFTYSATSYATLYFKIRSVDKFGQVSSDLTASAQATSPFVVDTVPPGVPSGLAATVTNKPDASGANASISWTNPSDSDLHGLEVQYKQSTDSVWSSLYLGKDSTSTTTPLATSSATYNFRIRAVDRDANYSNWSSTVNASGAANTAPGTTTGVVATPSRYSIRYSWGASSAADLANYDAQISTNSGFSTGVVTFKTGKTAFVDIGGLDPATTYYFRVRAVDVGGLASPYSAVNTTSTLGQLTPGDIGAPTTGDLSNLEDIVDTSVKNAVNEYAVNSSETVAPSTGWSTAQPSRAPGQFTWYRTKITYNDNTTSTSSAALLTGNTGAQGAQGTQGIQGPPGANGTSLFTWLKYADTPTTGMSDTPAGKDYIGLAYNKSSSTESTNYNDYTWSLVKGEVGDQGIQGPSGVDGESLYTWVKYANDVTGTDFSDTPENRTHIGLAYNKPVQAESSNPADYSWSLIKGADGAPAPVVNLTATAQVLTSPSTGGATNPTTSTITGQAINTTITAYTYSVNGGGFTTSVPTGVSRTGNVVTVTGSTMTARTIAVRMADAAGVADTLTVAKAYDGATGATGSQGPQGNTGSTGATGNDGHDAYTVLLTNEAQVIAAGTSAATAASYTTDVIAYKGASQQSASIGTVTGQVTGLTTTISGNGTMAPRLTINVTTSLTTTKGTLTIPVTLDGKTFTKSFSWSLSLKGTTGSTGATGSQGPQGVQGPAGADGTERFTWIKYADTPTTGMADTPTNKTYMGLAYNKTTATESSNYADYAWSLIKGADGAAGSDGKGISTTSVNYAKSTNGTTAPSTGWGSSIPSTVTGEFLWTRTITTYTDSTNSTAYSVAAHGAPGPQGNTGNTGSTGPQGDAGNGITGTVVDYQKSSSGTTTPTTWQSTIPSTTSGQYLWTRTVTSYNTGSPTTAYSVARHGVTGSTGAQGVPGPAGADGQPTYTWIKYGTSTSGAGFSDSPAGKTHIGIAYNKSTQTESETPGDYEWSLIQGPQGNTGATGNGITGTTVTYQTHSSGTATPGGTWLTSPPATTPGQYLWTRTVTSYNTGDPTTSYAVSAHGATGATGSTGPAGNGITGTVVTYQKHSNGVSAPSGTWTANIPVTVAGEYLWTRTITSYNTGTPTTSYAVGAHGQVGPAGQNANSIVVYGTNNDRGGAGNITVNGNVSTASLRGHNWRYINPVTMAITASGRVDTYVVSSDELVTIINDLPAGHIFAMASHDANSLNANARAALVTLGAGVSTTWGTGRTSHAFIGAKGLEPGQAYEAISLANVTESVNVTVSANYTATGLVVNGAQGVSVSSVTPYFRTVVVGGAAPAAPSTETPPAPWTTTEPGYIVDTELYRTERVLYSNGTYAYTTVNKVSAYTASTAAQNAAEAAQTAANTKTKTFMQGATPTASTVGDIWIKTSESNTIYAWSGSAWVPYKLGYQGVDIKIGGENLQKNSHFKSISGWHSRSNATIALSTAKSYFGSNSLLVTPTSGFAASIRADGNYYDIPVVKNTIYTITFWLMNVTGNGSWQAGMELLNSSHNYIYQGMGQSTVVSDSEWTRVTHTFAFTATNGSYIRVRLDGSTVDSSVYVGAVKVEEGDIGSAYSLNSSEISDSASAAQSTADSASSAAAVAAGIANSKAVVLYQTSAPSSEYRNNLTLWIDTTGGANTPKRWTTGTTWVAVTDKVAIDAASAAAAAQTSANSASLYATKGGFRIGWNEYPQVGVNNAGEITIGAWAANGSPAGDGVPGFFYDNGTTVNVPWGTVVTFADTGGGAGFRWLIILDTVTTTLDRNPGRSTSYSNLNNRVFAVYQDTNGDWRYDDNGHGPVITPLPTDYVLGSFGSDGSTIINYSTFQSPPLWNEYRAGEEQAYIASTAAANAQSAADAAQAAATAAQTAADSAQTTANTANTAAANAAGIANSKAVVLYQTAAPAAAYRNNLTLWIDTTGGANTPKRWTSGTTWVAVTDKTATDAASAAATANSAASAAASAASAAQSTADGKARVYYQATAPGTTNSQDLWIDTNGGANTPKRYSGGQWVAVTDKVAIDAASSAATANKKADVLAKMGANLVYDGGFESGWDGKLNGAGTDAVIVDDAAQAQTGTSFLKMTRLASTYPFVNWSIDFKKDKVYKVEYWAKVPTTAPASQTLYSRASFVNGAENKWKATSHVVPNDNVWRSYTHEFDTNAPITNLSTAAYMLQHSGTSSDATAEIHIDNVSINEITETRQALTAAQSSSTVYYQSTTPVSTNSQDLWIDTLGGNNTPKRYNGSTWVIVSDKTATDAAALAAGKGTVYFQNNTPASTLSQDLWIDTTNAANTPKRYNGSAWVAVTDKAATDAAALATTANTNAIAAQESSFLNGNHTFADWTGTVPAGFSPTGTGPTKETSIVRTIPNAMRFNTSPTGSAYVSQVVNDFASDYITVEIDARLVSGTFAGARYLIDWNGQSGLRHDIRLDLEVPNPIVGKWYRFTRVVKRHANLGTNPVTDYKIFLMANFSSPSSAKDIIFDKFGIRPSTQEEITAYEAPGNLSSAVTTLGNDIATAQEIAEAATAAGTNLIKDPSFEAGLYSLPSGMSYSTTQFKSGTRSVRSGGGGSLLLTPTGIPVQAGRVFKYSTWVYTDDNFNGSTGSSKLRVYDQNQNFVAALQYEGTKNVWREVSFELTVGAGITSLYFQLFDSSGHNGYVYVDDVRVEDITDRKALEASLATAQTRADDAFNTATGKNRVIWSTNNASGTSGYVAGDIWYKRDATNNIIAQWEFNGSTWVSRYLSDAVLSSLTVGKLVGGDISAITLNMKSNGVIKSDNYVAGTSGYKLSSSGLEVNDGVIKAKALSVSVGGGNLLENSSFVAGLNSWSVMNGTATVNFASSGVIPAPYNRYATVTSASVADVWVGNTGTKPGLSQGKPYVLSAYVYRSGDASTASSRTISVQQGTGTLFSSATLADGTPVTLLQLPTATWTKVYVKFTPTSSLDANVRLQAPTAGNVLYSQIQLEEGDVPSAYSPKTDEILPGTISGDMLKANTALVNDLTVQSNLTVNTGGYIKSSNYNSTTGYRLGPTGLEVWSGTIKGSTIETSSLVIGQSNVTNLTNDLNSKETPAGALAKANAAESAAVNAAALDASNKATAAEVAAVESRAGNPNSTFASWPGSYPTNFGGWQVAPTKETSIYRTAGHAVRFSVGAIDAGLNASSSFSNLAYAGEYIAVEMDVMLKDNGAAASFTGAGVLVDWGSGSIRNSVRLDSAVPAPEYDKWYQVVRIIKRPSGTSGISTGYVMANYSSLGSSTPKDIIFDRVALRTASNAEIEAYNAQANAQASATTAQNAAINAAALDASTKANDAQNAAVNAAATDASAKAATAAVASLEASQLAINSTFDLWTGTYPDWINAWSTGPTKAVTNRAGRYGLEWNINSTTDAGTSGSPWSAIPYSQYVTFEVDLMLKSGDIRGSGIYLYWGQTSAGASANHSTLVGFNSIIGNTPTLNKWYTLRFTIKAPDVVIANPSTQFTGYQGHIMANHSSLGGRYAKNLVIDRVGVRHATQEEVTAYEAPADATTKANNAISAAATDATSKAVGVVESEALNANSTFANWTGERPVGYEYWYNTPYKETTNKRTGEWALKFNTTTSGSAGLKIDAAFSNVDTHSEYAFVEIDVLLQNDGEPVATFEGSGLVLDWGNNSYRNLIDFKEIFPNPTFGRWYQVRQVLKRPGGSGRPDRGYIMCNWSNLGAFKKKSIVFDRVAIRSASNAEIEAYNAQGNIAVAKGEAITDAVNSAGTNADTKINNFNSTTVQPGLDAKVSNRAYSSSGSSSNNVGKWTKLATSTIGGQYGNTDVDFIISGGGSGSGTANAQIHWRVKQQAAFGSNPLAEILYRSGYFFEPSDFYYTVISNSGPTVVELWGRIRNSYENINYTPLNLVTSGSGSIAYHENTGFSTTPPTGLKNALALDDSSQTARARVDEWLFEGTTEINGGSIKTDTIDVVKLKAESTFTKNLNVANIFTVGTANSNGIIESYGYNGSNGYRIEKSQIVINDGLIKADTIRAGNLGGPSGINSVINVTLGTSIIMNGGYIKSTTNNGTTLASAETSGSGFFLNSDGLFIGGDSKIKAEALVSSSLTSATITMGTGGVIQTLNYNGSSGFKLSSSGLEIPNGSLSIAKVNIGSTEANGIISTATTIDGGKIKTGSITSTADAKITLVTPVYDNNGVQVGFGNPTTITDTSRKAFNISATGVAEFSDALVRGNLIVGVPSGAANGDTTYSAPVTVGITSGTKNVTAAEGTFKTADIGLVMTGTGIPSGATIASVGSQGNTAVLSVNATATNSSLSASIVRPARNVSTLRSYNYTEGATGWILRSDGTAELRELAYDSLDGGAIKTGTLRAESISSGSIEAALTISGSFETATTSYDVNANRTVSSSTLTRTTGAWEDADIGAGVSGVGIAPGTTILSYSSATVAQMSSAASSTSNGTAVSVRRGRRVGISSSGIVLESAAGEDVVVLPTDANKAVTIKGSIEANDLFVHDQFRMLGKNNSLGQGSELHLNAGEYAAPAPKVTFSYDNRQMTTLLANGAVREYNPSDDTYVNDPTGFCWDNTDKKYLYTYGFYGVRVARVWGPGNTGGAPDGELDFGTSVVGAMENKELDYAYGGMKVVGDDFYFFTKNISSGGEWRIQRVSRAGMNRSGGAVAGDRTFSSVWNQGGSLSGHPGFDFYGGNLYIAKLNNSNEIAIYKYNGTNLAAGQAFATVKNAAGGSIASVNVGTFDMGSTVYMIVTTQGGNSNTRHNYAFTVGTSSFGDSALNFPLAGGYDTIGTTWVGNGNADSTGHFRSLGKGGRIYEYSKFAATNTAQTIYSSAKWRNTTYNTYGPESMVIPTTVQRRAKMVISAGSSIPNAGGTSPNAVSFYMSSSASSRYRLEQQAVGVTSMAVETIPTSGTFTETAMPSGVPSKLLAGANLEISGDGFIRTNRMILQSTLDANTSGGNQPPLMIGNPTGGHLRLDGNEILAMTGESTQGVIYMNSQGQTQCYDLNVTGTMVGTTSMNNVNVTGSFQNNTTFDGSTLFNGANNDFKNAPTTTASANVNFNTGVNNRIRLITSLSAYKVNKSTITIEEARGLLSVTPKTWYDRDEWEKNGNSSEGLRRIPGVVAEDIEEHAPIYANYDNEGNLNGVSYDRMASGLLVIIKQQEGRIESLESENDTLRAEIEAIKNHLGM